MKVSKLCVGRAFQVVYLIFCSCQSSLYHRLHIEEIFKVMDY